MYYANEIVKQLKDADRIVIYGARIVAKEVAQCLMREPYGLNIECFMVTTREGNPAELLNVPVITLEEATDKYKDSLVIIAALEKYHDEIKKTLLNSGYGNIIPMGFESDIWNELRGNYIKFQYERNGISYLTIEQEIEKGTSFGKDDNIHVYRAVSHVDKPIDMCYDKYEWEIPIQVGAALTDKCICEIRDDKGDNISKMNKKYCELTALYWIWKNDVSKYAGICHYRRHFKLNQKMIRKLATSDIDVVLTIPILNFPSVRAMYVNDHVEDDWEIMFDAIRELCPEYLKTADRFQNGEYYYAYNMFIARKEILDDYCEWLFSILSYCEGRCKDKEDSYQNRYLGFLGERLLSIYFIHNWNKFKIVHANKEFLS